jgi:Lon protease-like protein
MAGLVEVPLFPLHAVLFPEGELLLRIFEPRYLDMISHCLKQDAPFGVSLITEGEEVGQAAESHELGTLARIRDWDQGRDGLLSVSCSGGRRFRILDRRVQPDQLTLVRVETMVADRPVSVSAEFQELVELLQELQQRDADTDKIVPEGRFGDAGWISFRLAERLPMKLAQRQYILQLDDPVQRLKWLADLLGMQH